MFFNFFPMFFSGYGMSEMSVRGREVFFRGDGMKCGLLFAVKILLYFIIFYRWRP